MRPVEPTFLDLFDALLLDMDGTLIHGSQPIEHAVEAVATARSRGLKISFATNNASRTPQMVVEHLRPMGFEAHPGEVVNSPMVAVSLVQEAVEPGSTILVVGGAGIVQELEGAGFTVVSRDEPDVAAVVQGFTPDVGWRDLAEAAYAIGHGAHYFATNVDSTLPTERGFAPGNGSLVAAVSHAPGVVPRAAGKPEPAMFHVAAREAGARTPLVVGDRLDTDLEGGNRAGMPTLQVLTGVSRWRDAVHAAPMQRPTYIRPTMKYLSSSASQPVVEGMHARFGATRASFEEGKVVVRGDVTSWRTAQVVLSLINTVVPNNAFGGEILSGEVDDQGRPIELYDPPAR